MKPHKHQWRKVGGSYSQETGLIQKKKCLICGAEK